MCHSRPSDCWARHLQIRDSQTARQTPERCAHEEAMEKPGDTGKSRVWDLRELRSGRQQNLVFGSPAWSDCRQSIEQCGRCCSRSCSAATSFPGWTLPVVQGKDQHEWLR